MKTYDIFTAMHLSNVFSALSELPLPPEAQELVQREHAEAVAAVERHGVVGQKQFGVKQLAQARKM